MGFKWSCNQSSQHCLMEYKHKQQVTLLLSKNYFLWLQNLHSWKIQELRSYFWNIVVMIFLIPTDFSATGFTVLLGWIIIHIWKEQLVLGGWNIFFERSDKLVSIHNLRPVRVYPMGPINYMKLVFPLTFPCLSYVQWQRSMETIVSPMELQISVLYKEQWVAKYSSITGTRPKRTT